MSLRFYIGGSGAGKSYQLHKEIITRSINEPDTNFLILVPDQFTMQTQKDVVMRHPNHGIMNIDVLSFTRLAHRIFDEVGADDRPILDDTGKSLVLRKVASDISTDLQVIGKNLKKIGYIHEVKSAISEFMQYGIKENQLQQLITYAENRRGLQTKLKDLAALYEAFLKYIQDKYITTEESLDLLSSVLERSVIIKNSVIAIDGFTGFTPVQNHLLQKLMMCAKEVIVTVVMDAAENPYELCKEEQLFYLSKKTIAILDTLSKEANIPRGEDIVFHKKPVYRYRENMSLSYLEQTLFRYHVKPFEGNQNAISIFEAENPQTEVEGIAKQIHRLIYEENYQYRDIAVVTGDLPVYAPYVEREFKKFGIPLFIDKTNAIVLNPFIETVRAALQILLQKFSYESIFHYLRCGFAGLSMEHIDRMENYVLALGIRGEKKWRQPWIRRSRDMQEEGVSELAYLNEGRALLIESLEPLLTDKKAVADKIQALYEFIVGMDMQKQLKAYEISFGKQGELLRAKEYAQVYRLVMELLDQMMSLLAEEEISWKDFADILDAGFAEIEVGSVPQGIDLVVVGDIERSRLNIVKAVFFIGVNDGVIPKNAGNGGIISDMEREFLRECSLELAPSPRQQMYLQRLYLYMNMTKPSEKLGISYARVNGEGKTLRPSYLINMLQKMYPLLCIRQLGTEWHTPVTPEASLSYFVSLLGTYAGADLDSEREQELFALYDWYQKSEKYQVLSNALIDAAFYTYENKPLSRAVANALYGNVLTNSVSRLEQYASCAYAHFLKYGLALSEREDYTFEAVDMGNVFHHVLELFSEKLLEAGYTWFHFPKEAGERLLEESLQSYAVSYKENVLFDTARNTYMVTRLKRILWRTVTTLQYQLKKGLFQPSHFELSFSSVQELESVNITLSDKERMYLNGRIDRIDTYEDDKHVYVKVIDYKSGNKKFDLLAMYYGLQLQLVVYLNTAVAMEQKKHENKEVVPAALLYYHIDDPMIALEGNEVSTAEVQKQILEKLRTTGIVNEDRDIVNKLDASLETKSDTIPIAYKKDGSYTAASSVYSTEKLQTISNYVNLKIKEIGTEILQGNIGIHPYEKSDTNACTYCSYKSICGFDEKVSGFSKRQLEKMEEDELFVHMEEKTEKKE